MFLGGFFFDTSLNLADTVTYTSLLAHKFHYYYIIKLFQKNLILKVIKIKLNIISYIVVIKFMIRLTTVLLGCR